MKITVFQSEKGDCLLLTSSDNRKILVDGGMKASYTKFVAPALGELSELDLVYISHIDQDHIAGVLKLMDDSVEWIVHDHQINIGNGTHPLPSSPRPPKIKGLWHNSFHELLEDNAGPVGDLLAASAPILASSDIPDLCDEAADQLNIVTSIPEAIRVSRRVSISQLKIPLNEQFNGKLAIVRENDPVPDAIKIGSLDIKLVGPFEKDLARLRKEWNEWLQTNKPRLASIQKQAARDVERLGTSDPQTLMNLQTKQAEEFGKRSGVTTPNLASLMLLIEENGKTLLLTGDGHSTDILKGLQFQGKLNEAGTIHVNVLKIQHHGAKNNIDEDFVSKVTADHYIFCGNGEHHNPEPDVVKLIIDSRLKNDNEIASEKFTFWFNSSDTSNSKPANKKHMKALQDLVESERDRTADRLQFKFLEGSTPSFDLEI